MGTVDDMGAEHKVYGRRTRGWEASADVDEPQGADAGANVGKDVGAAVEQDKMSLLMRKEWR